MDFLNFYHLSNYLILPVTKRELQRLREESDVP